MSGENIILTGIPRSGTTMCCVLLNTAKNVVALNEPIEPEQFQNSESSIKNIENKFINFRNQLFDSGYAPSRNINGIISDNIFSNDEKRQMIAKRSDVFFGKQIKKDFSLIIKHNAEFTQLIEYLKPKYPVYAIIRNPVNIIKSWLTVQIAAAKGNISKSERLSPNLYNQLIKQDNLFNRQLFILSWYFEQYYKFNIPTITYEDIVQSQGKSLELIINTTIQENEIISNLKQYNKFQINSDLLKWYEYLQKNNGSWNNYYSNTEISNEINKMMSNGK